MWVQWFHGATLRVYRHRNGKGDGRAMMAFTSLKELGSSAGVS